MLKENKKSYSKRGSKNPQWKGDDVGMSKLHEWVISRFPKTEFCNKCKVLKPLDLANKGIYNRDLKNWEWLCRRCHMKSDGRLKAFLSHQKKLQKGSKIHLLSTTMCGEDHPNSKLSWKQVDEIRVKYSTGNYTQQQLGDEYGVIFQSISLIINNKTWTHKTKWKT